MKGKKKLLGSNMREIRKFAGLNQTNFGNLFECSRGMIDSYERGISKPSIDLMVRISKHYNLPLDVVTLKDLSLNPSLLMSELSSKEQVNLINPDLIAAKDEMIKVLREQNKFLQTQVESLTRQIEIVAKKTSNS